MELTIKEAFRKGVNAQESGDFNLADRYYTAILKVQPKHPNANHNLGVLAANHNKFEQALPFFRNAVGEKPNNGQFWISYITALTKLGRLQDAKNSINDAKKINLEKNVLNRLWEILDEAISSQTQRLIDKTAAQFDLDSLQSMLEAGNFLTVLEQTRNYTQINPNSLQAWKIMGVAAGKIGNFSASISAFDKVLTIQSADLDALFNKGLCLQYLKKFDEAQEHYTSVIALDPNHAVAHNNLGNVYSEQGKINEAILAYKDAIKALPSYVEAYFNLAIVLCDLEKFDDAFDALLKAGQLRPAYGPAHYNLGTILHKKGKFSKAIEFYKKSLEQDSTHIDTYINLSKCFSDAGDSVSATEVLQRALSFSSNNADILLNLGNINKYEGKVDEAILFYEKAIKSKAGFAQAYNNMGACLSQKASVEAAVNAFMNAVKFKPDYLLAWTNCADLLEKSNMLEELTIWLARAGESFEITPSDLIYYEARLNWRKKDFHTANKLLLSIDVNSLEVIELADFLQLQAQCYEGLKNFDKAYQYFTKMNLNIKSSIDYSFEKAAHYMASKRQNLEKIRSTPLNYQAPYLGNNPEFTPVFLVGFPRSGTTLLDTILRTHSRIRVIEEKPCLQEAKTYLINNGYSDFINYDVADHDMREAQNTYFTSFAKHAGAFNTNLGDVGIDKYPLNIFETPLINRLYPNAKFILAVRHPLDTILSCWSQNFKLNAAMSNMLDLDRIVDLYCLAMETFNESQKIMALNVHEVKYEKLIDGLYEEIEPTLSFLDLNWERSLGSYQDTALTRDRINTPSYHRVVEPLDNNSVLKWMNYKNYFLKYQAKVEKWIVYYGYDLI